MKLIIAKSWTVLLSLLVLAFSAIGVSPAYAATFTVTNLNDSGPGSLRQAIMNANANAGIPDTITFSVSGTILLASTLPNITDASGVTIDGTGQTLTISGNDLVRVMIVDSGAALAIKSLSIAHGNGSGGSGGGIYNSGMLNIANSTISTNHVTVSGSRGGGIYTDGSVTITNTMFTSNGAADGLGGGLYVAGGGSVSITNSSFGFNTAGGSNGSGGGIFIVGSTDSITNSTFIANTAALSGGGIENWGSVLTIKRSSFAANSATNGGGGGIANYVGTLVIANSTLVGNSAQFGGGAFNVSTLSITNSDFANNTGGALYNGTFNAITGTTTLTNTIVATSSGGGNCGGTIINGGHNIDDGSSCAWGSLSSSMSDTNPMLGSVTGSPAYFPLNPGSPAIDDGMTDACANPPVSNQSQNGVSRPQGVQCDIGSFELDYSPMVVSSTRINAETTAAASVNFTVTFSEPVTGVDAADFSLVTSGLTGAFVTSVSPGPAADYTVKVITGTGNGTIRLDIPATATITDLSAQPLAGLPFTSGQSYTINKTLTFTSDGAQDGWVLESSETSGVGGSLNNAATTFRLGDDAARRQYRSILSFSTGASLPDTAGITGVTLMIEKSAVVGGGNPLSLFNGFMLDVKNGTFGTAALQIGDFKTIAGQTVGPVKPALVGNWYRIDLTGAKASINKLATNGGLTQIRLRFKLDDNNNALANYLALFSGNAPAANRPQLIIQYYLPDGTD